MSGFVSARVGNYQEAPAYAYLIDQMWVRLQALSHARPTRADSSCPPGRAGCMLVADSGSTAVRCAHGS
jgi:hypothetical protein